MMGTLPKSKFPDASQGLILQTGLFKDRLWPDTRPSSAKILKKKKEPKVDSHTPQYKTEKYVINSTFQTAINILFSPRSEQQLKHTKADNPDPSFLEAYISWDLQ